MEAQEEAGCLFSLFQLSCCFYYFFHCHQEILWLLGDSSSFCDFSLQLLFWVTKLLLNYNNYLLNLLFVQQIHVNKDQEEKTTKEEKNVENLEMSLVSFTFHCCEWQHQSKYDEYIGI